VLGKLKFQKSMLESEADEAKRQTILKRNESPSNSSSSASPMAKLFKSQLSKGSNSMGSLTPPMRGKLMAKT